MDIHFAELIAEVDMNDYYTIDQIMEKFSMAMLLCFLSFKGMIFLVSHKDVRFTTHVHILVPSKVKEKMLIRFITGKAMQLVSGIR